MTPATQSTLVVTSAGTGFLRYAIWRRQFADNCAPTLWFLTAHSLKARSDSEAARKLARMFHGAGFHSMSLVAVREGDNPNFIAKTP